MNPLQLLGAAPDAPPAPAYPLATPATTALNAAAKNAGVSGYRSQWSGQAGRLARRMPAAELVALLNTEFEAARRTG
jgi:nitronate monooxygenase